MSLNSDSKSASVGVNGWVYGAGFFALLAALAPFGVNLAVGLSPVFPGNVFMDADARAATVALFVLGLGLGQPLMGGAADHWGRRPAMMAGLLLGLLGAIAAAFSNSDTQLLWARFISGFGFSACMVVPRVCLRDLHQGAVLQRNMATLSNVFAAMPVITQPLAWALGYWFSWRVPLLALGISLPSASYSLRISHSNTTGRNTLIKSKPTGMSITLVLSLASESAVIEVT